jgi:conjugal transfer pilus assembly protein TraI
VGAWSLSVAPIPSTRPVVSQRQPGAHGLSAQPVDMLAEHGALLARIKLCYGADRAAFERELLPLIQDYADFVHRLPATADSFFSEPGGLLRLGLETAFFALQGTDAHIFSGKATISERVELEPRWRLATFIGGLCSELHRALEVTVVTDEGAEWPACLGPLAPWLAQQRVTNYAVHWRTDVRASGAAHASRGGHEARGFGLFALPHVVPAAVLHDLTRGNAVIVPHLMASVGGVALVEHNVLDRLVRRSAALVIHRNLLAQSRRHGAPASGEHLSRVVLDALRRLAAGHAGWTPNQDKSRVWYGLDGLFLLWPACGHDVLALLESDELAGMPGTTQEVLDVLAQAGAIALRAPDPPVWAIRPPGAKGPLEAIKLASPLLLLVGLPALAEPLDAWLVLRAPPGPRTMPNPQALSAPPEDIADRHDDDPAPTSNASTPALDADGGQLSLLDAAPPPAARDSPEDGDAHIDGNNPRATQPPAPPTVSFKAPMRLHPTVRKTLDELTAAHAADADGATLNHVDGGVFVALDQFQRRGIQPALALRALRDAGMLVGNGRGEPTRVIHIAGTAVPGVVLSTDHFAGLQPATPSGNDPGSVQVAIVDATSIG